jgi:hypothetical protein
LVQIADIDIVVIEVTVLAKAIMTVASPIPDCPVTHDNLKNNITPNMFRRHRTCETIQKNGIFY